MCQSKWSESLIYLLDCSICSIVHGQWPMGKFSFSKINVFVIYIMVYILKLMYNLHAKVVILCLLVNQMRSAFVICTINLYISKYISRINFDIQNTVKVLIWWATMISVKIVDFSSITKTLFLQVKYQHEIFTVQFLDFICLKNYYIQTCDLVWNNLNFVSFISRGGLELVDSVFTLCQILPNRPIDFILLNA